MYTKIRSSEVVTYLIDIMITLTGALLVLRFVLKLFGADRSAPFVQWVYDTSAPLLEPLHGMFPPPIVERGLVIEFTTVFAIVFYAVIAYLLIAIVDVVARGGTPANTKRKR